MNESEILSSLKQYSLKTKVLFEAIELIKLQSEKISKIKQVLREANCIADAQEFGLSYGQLLNYMDEIECIINK